MSNKILFLFILKVIALFFVLLALLYSAMPFYNLILSLLVEPVLNTVYPRFFDAIIVKNHALEVVTNFSVHGHAQSRLGFDIYPLKYSYGLPLFIALLIASKGQWQNKIWNTSIGFFVLLATQTWGLCFDITRNLLFEFQGGYAAYFEYGFMGNTIVSLGSQMGFLLFPSLIPVILWVLLMPDFFKSLINPTGNNLK